MQLLLQRVDSDNYCGCLQFSTSEERRQTLQIGVSIGVHGRRVPGLIFLLKVLDGIVFIALDNNRSSLSILCLFVGSVTSVLTYKVRTLVTVFKNRIY
jgi:hypothetical protein